MVDPTMHEALVAAALAHDYDPDAIVVTCRRHPSADSGDMAYGPFTTETAAWQFHLQHVTRQLGAVRCAYDGTSDDHLVARIGHLGTVPARLIDPGARF